MAASTVSTMAMINPKCMTNINNPSKPTPKLLSFQNLPIPKGLSVSGSTVDQFEKLSTSSAIAGAVFSALSSCEPAYAVQQIAEIAEGSSDNRGLALLLPIIPAIAWVLFNILRPALNQLNRMRSSKGVIIGLGLGGGLAAASSYAFAPPHAAAAVSEMAAIAEASGSDNRGQLLLFVVAPAIAWVLFNILQPALNQINRMRSQ